MLKGDPILKSYLEEIRKYSVLTAKEEIEIVKKCKQGNKKARETLVQCNLRLVVSIAKKYINCGLPLIDLIEEGNVGLLHAVERFDPERKCRFSTYATCWIKHSICRAITEKNQLIRIPAYMKKIISECKEHAVKFVKECGSIPTIQEIIDGAKLKQNNKKIVHEALVTHQALESMQSLQALNANQDWVEDSKHRNPHRKLFENSEFEWILKLIENLGAKRAQVIKLRYGLSGSTPMTLKEIAQVLKLTKERIRQIEKETLEMLRQAAQRRKDYAVNYA